MRDRPRSSRKRPTHKGRDRLFVAVYPPADLAVLCQAMLEPLIRDTLARFVPVEQVHLTLQFVAGGRLDEVTEAVRHAVSGIPAPQTLTALRPILLPQGDSAHTPPRLVALEVQVSPGLLEIQRRLARRLAGAGRADPGDRYLPHMTLCRFGPGQIDAATVESIASARLPEEALREVSIRTVLIVRSILRPEGAEHRRVGEVQLE